MTCVYTSREMKIIDRKKNIDFSFSLNCKMKIRENPLGENSFNLNLNRVTSIKSALQQSAHRKNRSIYYNI